MINEMRIGVIGAWGRGGLANNVFSFPDCRARIVAGADISPVNLEKFIRDQREKLHNPDVHGYLDYREMLAKERFDGVVITSPDFCHAEQACACLELGIPVYLEKPIAITIPDADRILQTAKDHRARLMLGHNMRYMKFVLKMRELIQSGAIGEVKAIWVRHFISYGGDAYFRDWHADRTKSTSLLLQKGAHDIDIIHWLAGSFTEQVSGMGGLTLYGSLPRRSADLPKDQIDVSFNVNHWPPEEQKDFNPVMDVEDVNMLQMRLANGVFATYMQCHYTPDACRNYTVIGTRGRIENYGDYSKKATIELWNRRNNEFHFEGDESFDVSPDGGTHGGADELIIHGFLRMIREGKAPSSTAQAARYSVAAGCCGAESIRSGGRVIRVPKLPAALEEYDFSQLEK